MQQKNMMEHKGFFAQIMEAERLVGDHVFGLPPGRPLDVYYADQFEKWPQTWCKGNGVFLVPVKPNKGLWLDWTMNQANNTAILPTVKGCNPITGQQTSGFHLERYESKCPKHGCDFMAERFCPECNYKWPFGNYVAAPNTLWIDGFVNEKDGTVRQFFFTEDELRDVATAFIGRENVIPAFGFAFYRPKQPRENPQPMRGSLSYNYVYNVTEFPKIYYGSSTLLGEKFTGDSLSSSSSHNIMYSCDSACASAASDIVADGDVSYTSSNMKVKRSRGFSKTLKSMVPVADMGIDGFADLERKLEVKEVSLGAGAKVNQKMINDPYPLDSWKDTPDAVMTIYFVFQEKFEELKVGGFRTFEGEAEGMLAKTPVG